MKTPSESQKYIAWDTSNLSGVISAFEIRKGEFHSVVNWSLSLETSRHSERLLWSIDTVLQSAGWKLEDLHGIAVGVGPGSFTGLRIGITTARILARTLNIRITRLSSLVLLARGLQNTLGQSKAHDKTMIVACTDATKGEWFTLSGSWKDIRDLKKTLKEGVFTPDVLSEDLKKAFKKDPKRSWIAVGQSTQRYPDFWESLPQKNRLLPPSECHQIDGMVLGKVAFEAIQLGEACDSTEVTPRYLRASEAEVKLGKGLLKPSPLFHRGGVA